VYELPENLSALTAEELQALIDQGLDELRGLGVTRDSEEPTIVEGSASRPHQQGEPGPATARGGGPDLVGTFQRAFAPTFALWQRM